MSKKGHNLDIVACINTLQELLEDTNQLFEIPEEQRVALFKAAGE